MKVCRPCVCASFVSHRGDIPAISFLWFVRGGCCLERELCCSGCSSSTVLPLPCRVSSRSLARQPSRRVCVSCPIVPCCVTGECILPSACCECVYICMCAEAESLSGHWCCHAACSIAAHIALRSVPLYTQFCRQGGLSLSLCVLQILQSVPAGRSLLSPYRTLLGCSSFTPIRDQGCCRCHPYACRPQC